jgi:uncharacterized membrane protein (UPF0182 family)
MSTIFALFSCENNYDQPDRNLVAWWSTKPDFETFCKVILGYEIPKDKPVYDLMVQYGDSLLKAAEVYKMHGEHRLGNADYRLEEIPEGAVPEK